MQKNAYFLLNKPFCNHFGTVFDLGFGSDVVLDVVLDKIGCGGDNSCFKSKYSCFKSLFPMKKVNKRPSTL